MCKRDERIVEEWNAKYPVGTEVKYWMGKKDGFPDGIEATCTEAIMLSGHTPVIRINGYRGCIALSHVEVVEEGR